MATKLQACVSSEISQKMNEFKRTGKVGTTTPRNAAHARQVAQGAAFGVCRKRLGLPQKSA